MIVSLTKCNLSLRSLQPSEQAGTGAEEQCSGHRAEEAEGLLLGGAQSGVRTGGGDVTGLLSLSDSVTQ